MSLQLNSGQLRILLWAILSIANIVLISVAGSIQAMILAVGKYYDDDALFGLSQPNFYDTLTSAMVTILCGMVVLLLSFLMIFRKKPYCATVLAIVVVSTLITVQWLYWTVMASA
jgi:hypothetical protein